MSLLRPGLHLVRRDDRHLQLGLDPPWRLVVPDDPEVHRVVGELAAGRMPTPRTPVGHRVLRQLRDADLLLPEAAPPPRGRVLVSGTPALAAEAERLLTAASLRVARTAATADVALILAGGEPPRDLVDEHLRAGRPHLVLGAGAAGYRIGPFVSPGQTACLRCVDAHRGEHDPRRAVVVEQLAGRRAVPEEPVLEALAVAWAVRDVAAYLAGTAPSTWSATVEVGADLRPRAESWGRHPWCGCAWDVVAAG